LIISTLGKILISAPDQSSRETPVFLHYIRLKKGRKHEDYARYEKFMANIELGVHGRYPANLFHLTGYCRAPCNF
jgi:hypothetical protein